VSWHKNENEKFLLYFFIYNIGTFGPQTMLGCFSRKKKVGQKNNFFVGFLEFFCGRLSSNFGTLFGWSFFASFWIKGTQKNKIIIILCSSFVTTLKLRKIDIAYMYVFIV
jgi:hypothetical protein